MHRVNQKGYINTVFVGGEDNRQVNGLLSMPVADAGSDSDG